MSAEKWLPRARFLLGFLLVAAPGWAESVEPPSGSYGVELEVERSSDGSSYVCSATVRDLASSRALSAPRMSAAVGKEAKAVTKLEIDGVTYRLALSVLVDEDAVAYRFEAHHGSSVASRQSGRIRLEVFGGAPSGS